MQTCAPVMPSFWEFSIDDRILHISACFSDLQSNTPMWKIRGFHCLGLQLNDIKLSCLSLWSLWITNMTSWCDVIRYTGQGLGDMSSKLTLLEKLWPDQHKINRELLVVSVVLVALIQSPINRELLIGFYWSGFMSVVISCDCNCHVMNAWWCVRSTCPVGNVSFSFALVNVTCLSKLKWRCREIY